MATYTKVMARTAASTSSTTLYTAPATAGAVAIVTNIAVTNADSTNGTFSLNLNAVPLFSSAYIASNSTIFIDCKQVLSSSQTISGLASSTGIRFHISGVEIY